MSHTALAELLFPNTVATVDELEQQYPPRVLAEGAKVTRIAPSPTGFMHLGNLFGALADERLAHQSGGVFFLRIEDTDQKREVAGGVQTILDVFEHYGLRFDEGATLQGDNGSYGPYRQRQRAAIYHVCAKYLVEQGMAYPCFLTEDELSAMREKQAAEKLNFGCYGDFAIYRNADIARIKQLMDEGRPYVVRFRSGGDAANRVKVGDAIRGVLELPENDQDVVILKADGIPTYHFAHVVDDHFMRTNIVVRGEEWLATLPIHVQLFAAMGWKVPKYLHTAHLMKLDGGSKRKLSKRKDPELALSFYTEQGYTVQTLKEYLLTLLNSNFEEWRAINLEKPLEEFPFSVKKMSVSGALFDIDKLNDTSRNIISRMDAEEVYNGLYSWAQQYDPEFAALLCQDKEYTLAMLNIGRGGKKPRKDITVWSGAKQYLSFYFEELFTPNYTLPDAVPADVAKKLLCQYAERYSPQSEGGWFELAKQLAEELGYASDMKAYRAAPENWPGSVADISMVIRLAITGRGESPDLGLIMQILGQDVAKARLLRMAEKI